MKYLRYYFHLEFARIKYDFGKGYNLLVAIAGSICYFFMHILGFSLVINKFSFPGWSNSQLWTLFFVFEVYTYLCFHFFWRGLLNTNSDISQGKFDYCLLKPVNTLFLSFFKEGSLNNIASVILGVSFLVATFVRAHLYLSPLSFILFIILLVVSLWQFHLLSASITTLSLFFDSVRGSAGTVFNFQEAWKYPSESFLSNPVVSLIVYPISLSTSLPALVLLNKQFQPSTLVVYIIWTIALFITYKLSWYFALCRYSSASS